MSKFLAALVLAIAAGLSAPTMAVAAISPAQADELMQKSGFTSQLAQIGPGVQAGLNLTPGLAATMPEADLQTIRDGLGAAFAGDRLVAEARTQLAKLMLPDDAKFTLAWLDSDLGKRITKLEDEAGRSEGFEERSAAAGELFKKLPQRRIERYQELAKVLNVGEAAAGIVINTTLATTRGAASLRSDAPEANVAEIRTELERNRGKLVQELGDQYLVLFAGAYQTLEDKEIDAYIAFSKSPGGKAYNEALVKVLDEVMTKASLESGKIIAAARHAKATGS